MAISYVASATCPTTAGTSTTLTIPSGTQTGDILVLDVSTQDSNGVTVSDNDSGGNAWTSKELRANGTFSGSLFWKRATSGTASKTITVSGGTQNICAAVSVYRGCVATGDPIEALLSEANASGNNTQAQITTLTAGAWVVLTGFHGDDRTFSNNATCTSPGALATRASMLNATGSPDNALFHASAEKATAGATGAFTWSFAANALGVSRAYALTPAAGGGPTPTRGRVSWAELETPQAPTRGRVSFAELETPNVGTRGLVSWAELEVPIAATRGQVSWAELEVPSVGALATRGQASWIELEAPDPPAATRGRIAWAELELPALPTMGWLSWLELELPEVAAGESLDDGDLCSAWCRWLDGVEPPKQENALARLRAHYGSTADLTTLIARFLRDRGRLN